MTDQSPHPDFSAIPDGIILIDGIEHMADGRGAKIPVSMIKPMDQLIDQTVRKILGFAIPLSDQVSRFKQHTFDDIGALEALLAEKYEAKLGGPKGNKTLMTHDTLFKVSVQVADNIAFGPELQVAKGLIDECLNEWAEGARDEIRTIVTRAFNTDKEGQINRAEIFMLLRLEIKDERWRRAMEAIRDAMRVVGSKTYVRCHRRAAIDAPWEAVTIDLAKA
ncbi:DUF3164 family protein [Gemmobacter denitrificans]|uniref:DUF3164 family protein n=1 Tax=Gemmobacter denitrificans TaxID=3123040 RepID=A0ABU8C079_9RHOB